MRDQLGYAGGTNVTGDQVKKLDVWGHEIMAAALRKSGACAALVSEESPEPIEKGLLRAKHGVFTFKDGTVRFDMINITLTHFKPRESNVTVEKLKELGYLHDVHGAPLERDRAVRRVRRRRRRWWGRAAGSSHVTPRV